MYACRAHLCNIPDTFVHLLQSHCFLCDIHSFHTVMAHKGMSLGSLMCEVSERNGMHVFFKHEYMYMSEHAGTHACVCG